jgi:hypothetical protein
VKFPEILNNGKKSYLPQVTKRLIHDTFFANVKVPELAGRDGGGERFARELAALGGELIARY